MNIGIMWFLRWVPITAAPLLIFIAIGFMIPGFWQYIASMWLSKRGRKIFVNRWWLRIPPLGIGLMFLGWVVSVICHALSACLRGFDFLLNLIKFPNVFRGLRNAITYPWFLGMEAIDFAEEDE